MKNTHCSECGTPYPQVISYPRDCEKCGMSKWSNPIPVAILLQPVWRKKGLFRPNLGLAIAYRAIEPCKGKPALIGGFIVDEDISVEAAAVREFKEETGLSPTEHPRLWYSESTTRGQLLQFCIVDKPMHVDEWMAGTPCEETESLDVIWRDDGMESRLFHEIAFPLHKIAIAKWFVNTD